MLVNPILCSPSSYMKSDRVRLVSLAAWPIEVFLSYPASLLIFRLLRTFRVVDGMCGVCVKLIKGWTVLLRVW